MRLRDWPPRRIGWMWAIGLAVQLVAMIVVPQLLGWRYSRPGSDFEEMRTPGFDTAAAPAPRGSAPKPVVMTRTPIGPGDTLVRIGRDSSFLEFRTSGGVVDGSPDVERGIAAVGNALGSVLVTVAEMMIIILFLVFTIPVILAVITLTWAIQRRRRVAE